MGSLCPEQCHLLGCIPEASVLLPAHLMHQIPAVIADRIFIMKEAFCKPSDMLIRKKSTLRGLPEQFLGDRKPCGHGNRAEPLPGAEHSHCLAGHVHQKAVFPGRFHHLQPPERDISFHPGPILMPAGTDPRPGIVCFQDFQGLGLPVQGTQHLTFLLFFTVYVLMRYVADIHHHGGLLHDCPDFRITHACFRQHRTGHAGFQLFPDGAVHAYRAALFPGLGPGHPEPEAVFTGLKLLHPRLSRPDPARLEGLRQAACDPETLLSLHVLACKDQCALPAGCCFHHKRVQLIRMHAFRPGQRIQYRCPGAFHVKRRLFRPGFPVLTGKGAPERVIPGSKRFPEIRKAVPFQSFSGCPFKIPDHCGALHNFQFSRHRLRYICKDPERSEAAHLPLHAQALC